MTRSSGSASLFSRGESKSAVEQLANRGQNGSTEADAAMAA